ncbi:glycosyltransferase [Lacisediminihabitans changchengi]|uniref:Glycosyltransferase n=1 Tax=Lacisediminihabitans changchengi TaxID=2787634 RepID=A0A934SP65_9MICO|nr:glycosyltransferase [Lacisediminihabitans changchengi]MBK4346445.1 glycosyltransferase [Lacisediminihabitans changchengi]MBK4348927.1 glycosyltransferase [Lacisediminihabitans changchengi]
MSIVTITWNNLAGLKETMNSVRIQDISDREVIEHIVVDNLSSDGTREFMESLARSDLRYVREGDSGIYDALNKGTGLANGRFILYLNAGDKFHDQASLGHMIQVSTEKLESPAIVFGAVQVEPGKPEKLLRNVPHNWFLHAFGMRSACHAATVFSASAVREAGGYSLRAGFAGDYDLILRLGLMGRILGSDRVSVDYDGTGLSAQRKDEIPMLLHRVRSERFQYPPWARRLDAGFVRLLNGYRAVRRSLNQPRAFTSKRSTR